MKSPKIRVFLMSCLSAFIALSAPQSAVATPISFSAVKSGLPGFGSYATDPSTGKIYRRNGYSGGNSIQVYNNEADFISNTVAQTVILSTTGFYGTYFAVNNGVIYGRTDSSSSSVRSWDATSGAVVQSRAPIPNMGGSNGTHTYDWGGYSGVNWMNDSSGLYVVGRNIADTDWQINRMMDGDLNTILATTTYSPLGDSYLGYGFIINGTLFTGANFNQNLVNTAVDVATGAVSSVNFTLEGMGGLYLSQFSYDYSSDTLYAFNSSNGTLYKASGASVSFGVEAMEVPEPGMLAILGLGLAGLGFARRNKKTG